MVKCEGGDDDDEVQVCGQTSHFISAGSDEDDSDDSAPVSFEGDSIRTVVDVDGDGCADLVSDAGELLSSRCDGTFDPAVQLAPWAFHMPRAQQAQDYNSSRSNKPSSIAAPDDSDDDGDFGGALPFFNGLEVPQW
jgi:hypothetical protein